ncbi:hypothetical protein [Coleofasciculus chthonoplastes]|uniref:hypothetical protein n=1 Tax=Coleofasciculus chthonoplastes TaxID=64178 RepID=UPI00330153A0
MKNLYTYLLATILGAVVAFSGINSPAKSQVFFNIQDINFKIYDNQNDILVEEQTNAYGLGMNIFMSILINQNAESGVTYSITVEGYGEGRENLAEGLVEDYTIQENKEVTLYYKTSQYIPFIIEYPCTEETTYTITVVQKGTDNRVTETIQSPHSFCILN